MKTKEFNRLLKTEKPKKIISDYMGGKIWLTDSQLEKVCAKNNGIGAVCFSYKKKVK